MIPNSVQWSLTDDSGFEVINNRLRVPINQIGESIKVTIFGDDLTLPNPSKPFRLLTVESRYDSTSGTDLPCVSQKRFRIRNIKSIPNSLT